IPNGDRSRDCERVCKQVLHDFGPGLGSIHHGETMKQKILLDVLAEDSGSVDAVLVAIKDLLEELQQGRLDDWENPTLERFLEAMQAWLETMGPRVGDKPSWKFLEAMIRAAKIYE